LLDETLSSELMIQPQLTKSELPSLLRLFIFFRVSKPAPSAAAYLNWRTGCSANMPNVKPCQHAIYW
jgi:hypothetical protein